MQGDIQATRAGLQAVRRKIQIAEKGHRLLRLKRDVLILELIAIAKRSRQSERALGALIGSARETLAIAKMMEGSLGLVIVSISIEEMPEIRAGTRNVMGMRLPVFTATGVRKELARRGYGLIGTTSVIDEAAEAYEDLTEAIVRHAEILAAIQILTAEILRLKRRVNALEFRVIPGLYAVRDAIALRRDEMEREEHSRIFWVKKRNASP
ncbi:MAG TPA: V-type ATP synthase subunit D [Methanoregula sp.]|nr:V-type ATP synthase subunit D [Methanoregula sp.]